MRLASSRPTLAAAATVACLAAAFFALAQHPSPEEFRERSRAFSARMEEQGLAEDFRGITSDGEVVPGLFEVRSSGVSTAPVREAADAFLQSLGDAQRQAVSFPVDSLEWRKWGNQHIYYREGLSFEEMSAAQREAALALLGASLSAKGLQLSRDIMRLNETLAELNDDNFVEYGEWKYWLSIMGTPSADEPWGWQLDGHHLNLNYFVLRDQVVMTPAFWGSEPAIAESGKYAGTRILQEEQGKGLEMLRALNEEQRRAAVVQREKTGNDLQADAFSDNIQLPYAGVRASDFTAEQKKQLLQLIGLYVGNMREGHAEVRLAQVADHLDETWFAWVGGSEDDSVYYYRIQSPVLLIEFDHQVPVGLRHLYPPNVPYREHIHAVVRTPNGNDYGKDLLRQHYERHAH